MARKLLMIDDDVHLMGAVGKFMELNGWEPHAMRMPGDALAKANSVHPDLILLDIEMPGVSGWDICRDLKKQDNLQHVPVIMMSGHRMTPEDKARGIEVGADDYLSKPFDLSVLKLKMDAILRVSES